MLIPVSKIECIYNEAILFTVDMFDERSAIREHAYPELKQFCLSKGLDFQLVDLNFGWRDEHPSLNIEQISKLYNHEIAECQNLSLGPSFVVSFFYVIYIYVYMNICIYILLYTGSLLHQNNSDWYQGSPSWESAF